MNIFSKSRFKIFSGIQHPYSHPVSDFFYSNPALPGASTLEDTLNTLTAAIWPNYKATVATPANLPLVGTLNDYYIVTDDGDGKSAGYVWQKIDNVEQWIKRYDWDWSSDGLLASAINSVAPYYVHKWGRTDTDEDANPYAGDLAGQRIYGGDQANQHLTLYANSGDLVGNSGFIQFGDSTRPLVDSSFSLGTNDYRFSNVYTDGLTSGTLIVTSGSITDSSGAISFGNENLSTTGSVSGNTLGATTSATISTLSFSTGSITDSSGAISFGNENLSTSGTLGSGTHTIGSLVLAATSITDTTGTISFDNENLITTGTFQAGAGTFTSVSCDDLFLNTNSITIATVDTNLILAANGTGVVDIQSAMTTLGQQITGIVGITGQLNADNIRIDSNTISSTNLNGNISFSPNGSGIVETTSHFISSSNNTLDIGDGTHRFRNLFLGNSIQDGTNTFLIADLMPLRSTVFRDLARTIPAQSGDALFYDAVNNIWLANHPDTEITHSELTGLTTTDAGHTQFVMLAGRAGGQSIQGGTAASENLVLESTAHATKGNILFKDSFLPFTNASYSGSWSGLDIGDTTHYIRDLYSKGEFKGFRAENYVFISIPASSAANIGRLVYVTDKEKCYVDTGSAFLAVGNINKFISDVSFNGVATVVNVDVSSEIEDARNAHYELLDNTNNFEKMFVKIEATTATNIRITTGIPLPAGSYRLIVME
jgi:hypothetical protein